jgi:hypothetical protein
MKDCKYCLLQKPESLARGQGLGGQRLSTSTTAFQLSCMKSASPVGGLPALPAIPCSRSRLMAGRAGSRLSVTRSPSGNRLLLPKCIPFRVEGHAALAVRQPISTNPRRVQERGFDQATCLLFFPSGPREGRFANRPFCLARKSTVRCCVNARTPISLPSGKDQCEEQAAGIPFSAACQRESIAPGCDGSTSGNSA